MATANAFSFVAGEPWRVSVTVQDDTNLRLRWSVVNIDPLGGAMLIKGATATLFAIGTEFALDGNSSPDVNRAYTVATATNSGSDVIVTVAASVVSLAVASVDIATSRLRVTTSTLASVSRFASGATVALSGNANDASNVAYRVWDAFVPSSPSNSLWVRVEPSLPAATTASGNLVVPTISPTAGQTAIATLGAPVAVDLTGWLASVEFRDTPNYYGTLLATAAIDTTGQTSGTLALSLTAEQTEAMRAYRVVYFDLVLVAPSPLAARSLRSLWTQGDNDPRMVRPTRVDNVTVLFGPGAFAVRNIPTVSEAV